MKPDEAEAPKLPTLDDLIITDPAEIAALDALHKTMKIRRIGREGAQLIMNFPCRFCGQEKVDEHVAPNDCQMKIRCDIANAKDQMMILERKLYELRKQFGIKLPKYKRKEKSK